ncbi:MAG: DNA methyltransferase [Candidatus Thorarchaeota archaeon]
MTKKRWSHRLNDLDAKEWVKKTKSWFVINPRRRTQSQLAHPAKYPEELVERFVTFFTREGQWVLDPFAGVGSTLIASKRLHRNCVGIELVGEFVNIAQEALATVSGASEAHMLVGDSGDIGSVLRNHFLTVPVFDLLMTSPPYWNMLRKSRGNNETVHKERLQKGLPQVYSSSSHDLGNIDSYEDYLDGVVHILREAQPFLRSRAYVVIVVQNMRDVDGIVRPVAWDLARRLSDIYVLRQEQIWCQDNKRLGCWGYPTTYVSNVHHHYCLILQNS